MITSRYLRFATKCVSLVMILFGACTQSDYTKMVKKELSREVRMDSVIFDIKLGDTRNEFYGKCFDLNKAKLVTQGPGGSAVQYLFTDSIFNPKPTPMRILFTPSFDDKDVMKQISLEFSYVAWSPWNKEYQSSELINQVKDMMILWYKGNPFVLAKVNKQEIPVKVDGNRRMMVYVKDERNVVVEIQDILHPFFKHSISN